MIKNILKKAVFSLFLLLFSCSECQDQSKIRALNWLNRTYGRQTALKNEDLFAYALRMETGIRNRKDALNERALFPVLRVGSVDTNNNCVRLLQCALLYKGYYLGSISGKFDKATASAVMEFKKHALGGRSIVNPLVTPLFLVAILDKGSYIIAENGDENLRRIQQYLNRNYARKCSIITTDGKYGLRTHFTLIQALQIETDCENTNGRFDQELTDTCPTLSAGMQGRLVYLLQCALYINGIKARVNGIYDAYTTEAVKQFQKECRLPQTGVANMSTIKALLLSTGDTTRPANACDTFTRLSYQAARALYLSGYRFVGRYLTGTIKGYKGRRIPKYFDKQELYDISRAGLRLFPIFQAKGGNDISSFTAKQGKQDAQEALGAIYKLGIPKGTTIYFSVDCDPLEKQILGKVIPYFREVNRIMKQYGYQVGVYGTRLTCSTVSEYGYAKYSFVRDGSPRSGGNVAQPLPKNWTFDQYYELKKGEKFKFDGGMLDNLDKVIASGRDMGIISPKILKKQK